MLLASGPLPGPPMSAPDPKKASRKKSAPASAAAPKDGAKKAAGKAPAKAAPKKPKVAPEGGTLTPATKKAAEALQRAKGRAASARGGRATAQNRRGGQEETASPAQPGPGEAAASRNKPERPDEFAPETFEFIAAVDEFKRRHQKKQLSTQEMLQVLRSLGYRGPGAITTSEVARVDGALLDYRRRNNRLFPGWSEIFAVLLDSGYHRAA